MPKAIRNIARLVRIAWILARHDALFPLRDAGIAPVVTTLAGLARQRRGDERPGQRLATALQALGPSFIKFGQTLATRPDLIGESVAQDLSNLQDRLPPFPARAARAIIEAELGCPLGEVFPEFDDKPVAAASIAQVHFARTTDGRPVAVKVLRPGIQAAFERDLTLFYWVANVAERARPSLRRLKPVETIRTLADSVRIEMDLRLEAAAASELAENLADIDGFRVPAIDWQHTSRRVLTLERMEGTRIDDLEGLARAGHDPAMVLAHASNAFFRQVFFDGFFHADLHPGNLMVDADGNVIALDFGIMGRLDKETRRYLAEMLLGFLTGDYARVADIHFEAGYVPRRQSKAAFTQAVRAIGEPVLGRPLHEISIARLLGHLFQVTKTFEMETQPQLLLLQKSLLMAEGLSRKLSPQENMWLMSQPLIEEWAVLNLNPAARLGEMVRETVATARRLPQVIERAEDILDGLEDTLSSGPGTGNSHRGKHGKRGGFGGIAGFGGVQLLLGVIAGLLAALLALQLV